jgi:hypothetical protein
MTDTATQIDTNCNNDDAINNIGSNAESVGTSVPEKKAKERHPHKILRRQGLPQESQGLE